MKWMFLKCSSDICNWIPRYQIGYPSTFFLCTPKAIFTFVCRRAIKSLETRIQLAELHAPLGGHLISWQQKYLKLIIPILTGHFGIQFGILRAYLGELCDNNKLTGVCVWSGFWRGGINGHGYYRLLLDRTCCSCNLDLFFLFLLPCIAVTAKSWQTVSVFMKMQSAFKELCYSGKSFQ